VLAAPSNPEAVGLQRSTGQAGGTVSAQVVAAVSARNAEITPTGEWGSLGFVIGATVDWTDAGIAPFTPTAPILGPGFGAQGAGPEDLQARYGALAHAVIASESRSLLAAGPQGLAEAIGARAAEYREVTRD
jgi:orotidine-5'-phosphate decarboxylase